jgi:hypothetical protein
MSDCTERYYTYKALGICVACGAADAAPCRVRCEPCQAKTRPRARAYQAGRMAARARAMVPAGLCVVCGKKKEWGSRAVWRCADCNRRAANDARIRRAAARAAREAAAERMAEAAERRAERRAAIREGGKAWCPMG